jgi:putative sterol carrier protein
MALDLNVDWSAADPRALLDEVRAASDEEIEAALAGPEREQILRNVFVVMARELDPERARGVDATIHFKVWDRPGGGYDHYELRIADGEASVSDTPAAEPTLTIKGRPADLIRVAMGDANAVKLAFRGRLRVLGDLNFARKVPEFFRAAGS